MATTGLRRIQQYVKQLELKDRKLGILETTSVGTADLNNIREQRRQIAEKLASLNQQLSRITP
jgi:Tfp pilus assembly protein PilO